jgi:addiction module RelE/StbE family toxin
MRIAFRSQALRDIEEIYRYIEERNPQGAARVVRAIRDGVHLVGEQPEAGQRTQDPTVRVISIRKYRYKIFYSIVAPDGIEIIHVRHTSRQPWTG